MSTRREFLVRASATIAIAGAAPMGCRPGQETTPRLSRARVKSLMRREETLVRYPVHGDNWHMTWGADDRQYLALCDGYGWSQDRKTLLNSRLIAMQGSPQDAVFEDIPGYPMLTPAEGASRYYSFGTLAVDGRIYQYLSTFNKPLNADLTGLRFNGAKLIYSPDAGGTWCNQDGSTPVVWEDWSERSRDTLVFFDEPQEAFSTPSILQMGRNYELNQDGYVYVYAPNGNTEGTMNQLVMLRVPKARVAERDAYEYFAGRQQDGTPRWVKDIHARAVVHTFPIGWVGQDLHPFSWMPSIVYNAPLGLYMMTSWGTGIGSDGKWFAKPSYLGFWMSHTPWGPWTQVHEEIEWSPGNDPGARGYTPVIAPKWISADGKSFWLAWTDYQSKDPEAYAQFRKAFNDKKQRGELTDADLLEEAAMRRRDKPYYAINLQRIDLEVEG